jgi:hypothetical protein
MTELPDGRWWTAMVTFERLTDAQDILAAEDHGAVGWMVALAPDEDAATDLIVHDLADIGLRVIEIEDIQEFYGGEEIEDAHLAANFRNIEPGARTVWGTIHAYRGDGEA